MEAPAPFIVYALPRSRTAWISALLTYRDWVCSHEQAVTMRCWSDVERFFAQPRHGTVETGASPGWRLIQTVAPDIRSAVIYRPVEEVIESFRNFDDITYDFNKLRRNLEYFQRCLDQIAARPETVVLLYGDLDREDGCRRLFQHCLPYDFDLGWWRSLRRRNIQMDVHGHLLYCISHRPAIDRFKSECKAVLRASVRAGVIHSDRRSALQD